MGSQQIKHVNSIPDTALECVFSYIDNPHDRAAISLVCKRWYILDNLTRKSVTVAFCYTVKPSSLTRRFKGLEALKLKGKPRASMFKLIPEDWGGYAEAWVKEVAVNCEYLKAVHLRRMIVSDEDLMKLARERGHMLQVLKLDKCSGFSTIGLEAVSRFCRSLKVLFLDESIIEDRGAKWLHELALHNTSLEVLNLSTSSSLFVEIADLETLVTKCKWLTTLNVNEIELTKLPGVLNRASGLQELGGVVILPPTGDNGQQIDITHLPKSLISLVGSVYMGGDDGDVNVNTLFLPLASNLEKLDLQCTFLSIDGHCQLLCHCCNLGTLEVLNAIGDEGLEVVANTCKNLHRLRVENGGDKDVQQGIVTHEGLKYIAEGCPRLEYIAVYCSSINNAMLMAFGKCCKNLKDFRLVLLEEENAALDCPVDEGVAALLQGCSELTRFALYLKPGLLTDRGMGWIGRFGCKLKWALLGLLGESDLGFSLFADGCPNLEKLEMRDCVFSEAGIAKSVLKMKSLKYIWVQGYKATDRGLDLLTMKRPFWNIEFIPNTGFEEVHGEKEGIKKQASQFLAYYTLAGCRTDNPETVTCLS